jgi:putative nucleotidyltransferase with HDIG domain
MKRLLGWKPSLLTSFSLLGGFITAVIAIVFAWNLEYQLEQHALQQEAVSAADQLALILIPDLNLSLVDLSAPLDAARYAQIDALIRKDILQGHIVRVKIWNKGGMVVYSDEKSLVGQYFPVYDELEKALDGEIAMDVSILNKAENVGEKNLYTRLLEVYVPIQLAGSNEIVGAYEIYQDLTILEPVIAATRRFVWISVGLGFLVLYGSLFILVRNASLELVHRNDENKLLYEQEQTSRAEIAALYDLSRALADTHDFDSILALVARHAVETVHVTFSRVALLEGNEFVIRAAYPIRILDYNLKVGERDTLGSSQFYQRVLEQNTPTVIFADSPDLSDSEREMLFLGMAKTMCLIPLRSGKRALGFLMFGEERSEEREPFSPGKIRLARSIGDQAASTLHRALLHGETARQLDQLQALHGIDQAIAASMDLRMTLNVLLEHVLTQLKVDAASVLLLNPHMQTLEYAAGRGFRTEALKNTKLRVGEGYGGRAALDRKLVYIPDLRGRKTDFLRSPVYLVEGFVAYYGIPLIAKGQVKGVLEIFHRAPLGSDSAWLNFFETLAEQAAIAIDNAQLFENLQRSNVDLVLAYDATIEGWSAALDLRDKETEGHSQRVTEMTMQLARSLGIGEAELVHVRRGALLHDIGKMGVPDTILLKPDKLTDEEWVLMRRHPQFAFDMLAPITYLKPALDIPYCHHEKWDGTGYPRGLKGEEIPLSARIFAVVDVYDALTSDRPYRKAWPEEKVLEHIKANIGTHFDPKAVELLLKMISEKTEEH